MSSDSSNTMEPNMSRRQSGAQGIAMPKLKDSCTACATSKVKCSKDKPNCARCTRRGLQCEYVTSKRTGRTSHAASKAAQQNNAPAQGSTEAQIPQSTPRMDTNISPLTLSEAPMLSPGTFDTLSRTSSSQAAQSYPDLWRSLLEPGTRATPTPGAQPSYGGDMDDLFASLTSYSMLGTSAETDLSSMPTQSDASSSISAFDPFSVSDMGQDLNQDFISTDLNSGFHCQPSFEPSSCCLTVALGFLTQLIPNASTACMMPGSFRGANNLPTIDKVINDNRQIIDQIVKMLECPCSHDEYLLTIIALVVFKVMGWYAAAARDKPNVDEDMNWASPDIARPVVHGDSYSEKVLKFPGSASMDGYSSDGSDQGRMAAQAVLGELHRVQRLVNLLSSRLEGVRLRNHANGSSSSSLESYEDNATGASLASTSGSPLSSASFDQLEADLRKRLRAVSFETIDVLRRG